jgi:uncharacterized membrane protein (DUF2068 family)
LLLPQNLELYQLTFPNDQLHVATVGTYNLLFPQNCVHCCAWYVCQATHLVQLCGLWMKVTWTELSWLVDSCIFMFINAASRILQSVPLAGWHSFVVSLLTLFRISCHTVTRDWNCNLWDAIVTTLSLVERFGNSVGLNYKFDHTTHSDAFGFHSCAILFMSSVTVKWCIFHVYTLYNEMSLCLPLFYL